MLDRTMMLWVNMPLVGIIYPQSNKFVMGVKIEATADSRLKDSRAGWDTIKLSG